MGTKKKIAKFLRQEAAKLPPELYKAYHKYSTIQYHKDGDQAYPVYGEVESHKVNHARRLKRLYKKHGKEAIDKYFGDRGFKLIPKDGLSEDSSPVTEQQSGGQRDSQSSDIQTP